MDDRDRKTDRKMGDMRDRGRKGEREKEKGI